MIFHLTVFLNYLAMGAAIWLGLYVVSNGWRRLLPWLTGLTLWFLAGMFINILFALIPPPAISGDVSPLQFIFPFWEAQGFTADRNAWLLGWTVIPAIMFWHHASILFRSGKINIWRWVRIIAGYLIAIFAIFSQRQGTFLYVSPEADPLYIDAIQAGPTFPFLIFCLISYISMSLINLRKSARSAPTLIHRKQIEVLAVATLIAGFTGPIFFVGTFLNLRIPFLIQTILLLISMILIGYGVARYSALMQGRTIRKDFYYKAFAMFLVTGIYILMTWVSVILFEVPAFVYIFVVILAIVTHSLVDVARRNLDYLFFGKEARQARKNLLKLVRQAGMWEEDENSTIVLADMCVSVRATFGLLFEFKNERAVMAASFGSISPQSVLPFEKLQGNDVQFLAPDHFGAALDEASLLIPLYSGEERQIGALVLGRPVNAPQFSKDDLNKILYPGDQLADLLQESQAGAIRLAEISELAQEPVHHFNIIQDISPGQVEEVLRKLFDYSYLGQHSMANLALVEGMLEQDKETYLDRGKALNKVLVQAIEKLRPDKDPPKNPPPREWYAYSVLYDAYVNEVQNRDIMSRLYISEGTFNRTRRSAIRSVALLLEELEQKR